MEFIPPPETPLEATEGFFPEFSAPPSQGILASRKARVGDMRSILGLVNGHAAGNFMLARSPHYIYQNIRDFVVHTWQPEEDSDEIHVVACGGLHVLWADMAEIRALAVHPLFQGKGLGARLVQMMIEEARTLDIKHVFAFTLNEQFFLRQKFTAVPKKEMPQVLWSECCNCSKYFKCDEVGMRLDIE